MKICDIVQFYSPLSGGVKRYILNKISFFRDQGETDHIIIVPDSRNKLQIEHKTRIYHVKSLPLIGSQSYRMLFSKKSIAEIIETEKPDLLEVGDPYRSAWIAVDIAQKKNIPIVSFYHSDYPRALDSTIYKYTGYFGSEIYSKLIKSYLNQLYNKMYATVVATERIFRILKNVGIQHLIHIPLGTDPMVFYPRDSRRGIIEECRIDPSAKLLLYVGRLSYEKNVLSLVSMLDYFSQDDCYHLILVGDGELRKQFVYASQTRKNFTWLPYCENTDRLSDIYSASDLFVHPSPSETFGLVSLEAQACGTRVLAVKDSGVDETIIFDEPLILSKSQKPEDLAKAVQKVFSIIKDTNKDRQIIRQKIIANFSSDITYKRLTKLYMFLCK